MLEFSYVFLSVIIVLLIFWGHFKWRELCKNSPEKDIPSPPQILGPIAIWVVYILLLSFSEILKDYGFPPRFPLLVFLPFFTLVAIFYVRNKDHISFAQLPLKWTTFFQSFRIAVELILLWTFYKGIIPVEATFEGFNYDILIGFSALLVGLFFVAEIKKYKTLLVAWNILGIIMVLIVGFIVGTSFYQPWIWGSDVPIASLDFVGFPYLFIPGILAPSAIFMHVVSLIQIRNQT